MNNNQVHKTNEDWKKKLTPEQYRVMREKGTEPAFAGRYWNAHDKGMYKCAACGNVLFSSDTKFDSGTGWPSFYDVHRASPSEADDLAHNKAVKLQPDSSHGMTRTEVICARCGSHLGHLFDDGPKDKGGKRYCINSCALNLDKEEHGLQ